MTALRRRFALMVVVLGTLCCWPALAREAKVTAREAGVSPHSGYVPVRLDDYANDQLDVSVPSAQITVNGVPFDLIEKPGANNLFLKDAGWSDWEKDPSSYYSAYDGLPGKSDPSRLVVHVPVVDYSAVYLLAATDNSEAYSPVVSFRIGAMGGSGGKVTYHDFSAEVPRMAETGGATVPTDMGNLFLVRVPLGQAIAQDFDHRLALDVDVTKELRLAIRRPDPARYRIRPLGLPSGVRIFAMTFQRSPIQMEVRSAQPGYVFNEPETPSFEITLRKTGGGPVRSCAIEATATDYYGNVTRSAVPVTFRDMGTATVSLPVRVVKRGHHDLTIEVKLNGPTVLTRETSFALLPRDTRKHRRESPFGTWDFSGGHFTPNDPELVGPLYVKAGLRYGMFGFNDEIREKYGIIKGNDSKPSADGVRSMAKSVRENPNAMAPKRLMIFHETGISGPHITRVPDLFTGRQYKLDEKEQTDFKNLWETAEAAAKAMREEFPQAEIYFGNGNPMLLEEFLRHEFPAELLGSRGNEAGNYMRMPEAQPPDWIANGPGLWMDRMLLDHYGYEDTPLRQCYEMCYASTNPGNLSLRTQAEQFVRHMMHSLAWEIPVIRACLIADVGNSYYFSNWGSSGLCHAKPHVRPKPSYVACATMTLLLDGAKFTRVVPTGSPVVYACEFERKDGKYVTCLWTIRGTRALSVRLSKAQDAVVTDIMANETSPAVADGAASIEVSSSPVFLVSSGPVEAIIPGLAAMAGRPEGEKFLISPLDKMADWTLETQSSTEMETYSFIRPRRKGNFEYAGVDSLEGEENVLSVKPILPVEGSEYLPMYSVLAHNEGVEIPGVPTQIGLMLNGNGGWGRIMFELEDASGQRWISIGAEQGGSPTRWLADLLSPEEFAALKISGVNDWNTDDPWGRSYVNFEGWRYLKFPLPGNYPGEGYHWPYSSQWRYSGDGVVKYPLTFKKLVITMPEKALHLKEYGPVPRQETYIKDLMVTYLPPEEAFVAE